ncbi:MAG: chromosome partitioning protein ParB [Desulfobulbus propionicus]|nr:MAG: chromosome partitioning protein ParB [Desulfobulbus propionicus]
MSMKNVLGRGVGALLPSDKPEDNDRFFMCDIEKIDPNPHQPRSCFDQKKLEQLSNSIREKGVIQPLLVNAAKGGRYRLIAGERRLRAAKMAGREDVPVVVMENGDDCTNLELALIENIQRHDLNPIEEALAYTRLIQEFSLSQEDIARKVGKKRSTITNVLRLLNLPEVIQQDIISGTLSEGHARVLLRLKDDQRQLQELRDIIITKGLSVRAAEKLCKGKTPSAKSPKQVPGKMMPGEVLPSSYCKTIARQITNYLDTKVKIIQNGKRGKLEIEYYSSDDLDRIVSLLSN